MITIGMFGGKERVFYCQGQYTDPSSLSGQQKVEDWHGAMGCFLRFYLPHVFGFWLQMGGKRVLHACIVLDFSFSFPFYSLSSLSLALLLGRFVAFTCICIVDVVCFPTTCLAIASLCRILAPSGTRREKWKGRSHGQFCFDPRASHASVLERQSRVGNLPPPSIKVFVGCYGTSLTHHAARSLLSYHVHTCPVRGASASASATMNCAAP